MIPMEFVSRAHDLAADLLRGSLPRRWRHVQAVAAKARGLTAVLPENEGPTLIAAAWLHDIGYSPGLQASGLHALDGARWLRERNFDDQVTALVAYHSCAVFEADERGLGGALRSEFNYEVSPLHDALWYADMTTGPDGRSVTAQERLAEVRHRYGPDNLVTRFWVRAEPTLMEAVRRTERRLRASGIQPM